MPESPQRHEDQMSALHEQALILARVETKVDRCLSEHVAQDRKLEDIDGRMRTTERLIWIAVGGVSILGAFGMFAMSALLKAIKLGGL